MSSGSREEFAAEDARRGASGAGEPFARALQSFEGLRVGDCFGEQFLRAGKAETARWLRDRTPPPGPWPYTDDSLMAASLLSTLAAHGGVKEESLAAYFVEQFDASRGYGRGTYTLLERLRSDGTHGWREAAGTLFAGAGSLGNGAAMRVAPLGAYFAEDPGQAAYEAARSARVTHAHVEAGAGAVAVAVAAALAWQSRGIAAVPPPGMLLETVREYVDPGAVRDGLTRALDLGPGASPLRAAALLGCGARATAADTVPFALWSAARSLGDYEEALWQTVSGGGDRDTTCAIVGGVVVLRAGVVPEAWKQHAERVNVLP